MRPRSRDHVVLPWLVYTALPGFSGSKVGLYIVQRGIEFHRDSPLDADHLRDIDGLHKFFVLLRFCQMLAFAELQFNVTFEETQAERRDPRSSFAGRGRGWARC